MLPFAYILTTYRKFKLIFHHTQITVRKENSLQFLLFMTAGPVMLLCSQFVDIYYFIAHLYFYNASTISSDYMPTLSPEAFNTLEAVV